MILVNFPNQKGFPKSQPRTGHTREPDPTHNELKHTITRLTRKTATHERNPDTPHVHTHTHNTPPHSLSHPHARAHPPGEPSPARSPPTSPPAPPPAASPAAVPAAPGVTVQSVHCTFPIVFGYISYQIRIVLYLNVSSVYLDLSRIYIITSRYIKIHQDTSRYIKIHQDTSRYICIYLFGYHGNVSIVKVNVPCFG